MKNKTNILFPLFVTLGIAPCWAICSATAAEANADTGVPTQVFRLHIGKYHLDKKDVSWFSSGKPEVRIVYRHAGSEKTWTSLSQFTTVQGLDNSFNSDVDLPVDLAPTAPFQLVLIDVGRVWDGVIIDKTFPALKLREVLAGGQLRFDKSWIEVGIVDPPGRYEVRLERTWASPEDFEAIGGTLPKPSHVIHPENWIFSPIDTASLKAADLLQSIKESIEKCDNLVIVEQNGKTIFNSSRFATPQGLAVLWDPKTKFEINWKPGDRIAIRFQDHNTVTPNRTILEQTDNSDSSISLLQSPIRGGKQGNSTVLFCSHRLEK